MNIAKQLEKRFGALCGRYGSNAQRAYAQAVQEVALHNGTTKRRVELLVQEANRKRLGIA